MSERTSDITLRTRGGLRRFLSWVLVIWIAPTFLCAGELTDYPVARFTVTDDGRLQPEAPDPKEPLEVVLGARVPGARWVHPDKMPQGALDGPPPLQPSWQVQTWRVEQGLPENEIKALCQTPDGYLWVGTPSGLARFDGNRFVVFNQRNTPVLQEIRDDIRVLRTDREGRLWVGAQQGIARFDRGKWEKVCHVTDGDSTRIRDLSLPASGRVWVATDTGVRQLREGRLSSEGLPELFSTYGVNTVLESRDGFVWAGGPEGLLRWERQTDSLEVVWSGQHGTSRVSSLREGSDGTIWVGSAGAIRKYFGGKMTHIEHPNGDFAGDSIRADRLELDELGRPWATLGSEGRVYRRDDEGLIAGVREDALPIERVQSLCVDTEGNIWCGTQGDGLHRLVPRRVAGIRIRQPLGLETIVSVSEGPENRIWCGTADGVVEMGRHGMRITRLLVPISFGSKTYSLLHEAASGRLWSSFAGRGIVALGAVTGDAWAAGAAVASRLNEDFGQVRALAGCEGRLAWVGSARSLTRYDSSLNPTHFGWDQGVDPKTVRVLLLSRAGDLWVGTMGGGLARLRRAIHASTNERFEKWSRQDGLPSDFVRSLHEDSNGVLWIGTDVGLARLDASGLQAPPAIQPPFGGAVHQILEDDFGYLWLSSKEGIHRVLKAELNGTAQDPSRRPAWASFSQTDGMPNASTAGDSQHTGCKAQDGRLYFPTAGGLAVIDPSNPTLVLPSPRVLIEHAIADGRSVWDDGEPGLEHPETTVLHDGSSRIPSGLGPGRARDLRIRYTSTSLTAPERLRFEYRLEGLETEWRPGGAERMAYYTNLKPGNYRFQVRAANHQGTWSEAPAEWAFRLEPAFHQTALFPLTIALVGVAVAGGFTLWRLSWQRKVMLLEQRVALDRERKRIARDMHDDLGAQLSTLALQLSGTSEATARTSADAQHKVRDVIRHLNSLIWAVEPGHESVEALTDFLGNFAQDYLARAGLRTSLECSEASGMQASLSTEARRHVVAVVKEALRNVVRHAHATEVRLRFAVQEATLVVEIEDDGQGFDASQAPQDRGLGHMRERLSEVGGRCDVASVPGQGTRIRIAVGSGDVAKPKNPV